GNGLPPQENTAAFLSDLLKPRENKSFWNPFKDTWDYFSGAEARRYGYKAAKDGEEKEKQGKDPGFIYRTTKTINTVNDFVSNGLPKIEGAGRAVWSGEGVGGNSVVDAFNQGK